jgi:hypothetical protein
VDVRRLAIASILAVCLGGPVVEMFDQWDHTLQDGTDTEANMVVVALCFGVALSVAGIVASHIRAMSSHSGVHILACAPRRVTASRPVVPIPAGSPPTPLRV